MQGEEFRICLAANTKLFAYTPHVPYYLLIVTRRLLESQNIIARVTEATTWCAPVVVTPKKELTKHPPMPPMLGERCKNNEL